MFGPTYFSTPIVYPRPQYRFDLDDGTPVYATSALFAQGIGAILRPLPAGEYLFYVAMGSPILGDFEYRYHITVVPYPQVLLLLGLGTVGLAIRMHRRRRLEARTNRSGV